MLESLADAKEERDKMSADVVARLRVLDEERVELCYDINERILSLIKSIESATLSIGASEKGSRLHAVYTKGRESWDSKGLGGYAVAHPEVNAFKKVGNPSVSIRAAR